MSSSRKTQYRAFVRLQRPPQPFHVGVDRPVGADHDARWITDLPQAAQETRQIRGPMGEDAEGNLVPSLIPTLPALASMKQPMITW